MKRDQEHEWKFRDSWRKGTPEMSVIEVHEDMTATIQMHNGTTKRMTCKEVQELHKQLGDACYWMGFLSEESSAPSC